MGAEIAVGDTARGEPIHGLTVPHSAGTESPRIAAPPLACDAHLHIYDSRFPSASGSLPPMATLDEYRLLQARIGTTRAVVVTPRAYSTANRCTLDALRRLGPDARGVAVLHPGATDAELKELADGGVCGIRFSIVDPGTAVTKVEMIEPLSRRVADLGWHVQLHLPGERILELEGLLKALPTPIVFDHLARLPLPAGARHPAFRVVCALAEKGRAWVKLSGAYLNRKAGAPTYDDATLIARAYVSTIPDRLVWGSDWPHPSEKTKPDDAVLFDLLAEWAPDEAARNRILVDNPALLYGFPSGG